MGVLEDAIREHLDLKRKHGAAEDELERQENEALGPVRRELATEQEPAAADAEVEAEPVLPPDPPLEPHPDAAHDLPADPEPDYPSSVDQPTELFEPLVEEGEADEDDELLDQDESSDGDENHERLAPDEPGDGDVLEDTPDFLQDAPEHDRLWFEQKPPRDFDFD